MSFGRRTDSAVTDSSRVPCVPSAEHPAENLSRATRTSPGLPEDHCHHTKWHCSVEVN